MHLAIDMTRMRLIFVRIIISNIVYSLAEPRPYTRREAWLREANIKESARTQQTI